MLHDAMTGKNTNITKQTRNIKESICNTNTSHPTNLKASNKKLAIIKSTMVLIRMEQEQLMLHIKWVDPHEMWARWIYDI